jgi:hypothetical protein
MATSALIGAAASAGGDSSASSGEASASAGGRGRARRDPAAYARQAKLMDELGQRYLDGETAEQETAREVATAALATLEAECTALKRARRRDTAAVEAAQFKVEQARRVEAFLLERGAAPPGARTRRRCWRRAVLVLSWVYTFVVLPPQLTALLAMAPSVNEIAIRLGDTADTGRAWRGLPFAASSVAWALLAALGVLLPPLLAGSAGAAADVAPLLVFGLAALALQIVVAARVWSERRIWRSNLRRTTPPFANGFDARSVLLVLILVTEGLQQSAMGLRIGLAPTLWG